MIAEKNSVLTFLSFERVSFWKPENNSIDYLYAVETSSLQQVRWLKYPSWNSGLPFFALQIYKKTPSQKNSTNFMFLLDVRQEMISPFLRLVDLSSSYSRR